MKFSDVVKQTIELLRESGRVTYRTLKREFALDDDALEDLKFELIEGQELAADKDGKMLVWTGTPSGQSTGSGEYPKAEVPVPSRSMPAASSAEAERRQLTVMFCDLVGSTALSAVLDPEELREVVRVYQATCTEVIRRYDGHIAQYLGDGLLIYFGYPVAHEDDAARAVRVGLEIIQAIRGEGTGKEEQGKRTSLHIRIGIHTGLVVVGEIGSSEKREMLALGETPNIAARVQGLAEPDTVVLSAAAQRLVAGLFECQALGPQTLKGIALPMAVYCVVREGTAQSRFEVAVQAGLVPLVGREEELALLRRRWAQVTDGAGQVVLVSGEPGIGKSRLVQEFKEQLGHEEVTRIELRCSPYHQNSVLYPLIYHLQHLLQFARDDSSAAKLEKLHHTLSHYRFPQDDTLPLLATLLSLPHPEGYPPITFSPQKQKEKTQAALVAWLVEEAELATVYCTWEDLHWADPSTLEMLTLLLDQVPTTWLLALLTFRPEFTPPWGNRSHVSQLTLIRLGHSEVETMVGQMTGSKALPPEVVQQIVAKTDGVPLFVEELTKTIVESGLAVGAKQGVPLPPLAIPATLQDALMARLDRLSTVREIAQLGATVGREFSYELLHAVSRLDAGTLQQGLKQLVEAELVYQRGVMPQARYLFKHALIQDTAYQSLLKSTRQQYHTQIARVLEEQFPETRETQPELVAHHYTEAGRIEQAIPYWQQAGERANQRSGYVEAVAHFVKALALLQTLPSDHSQTEHELALQLALGPALIATRGWAAPEVEQTYTRAQALCQRTGEFSSLVSIVWGLWLVCLLRAELPRARALAEQLLSLAHRDQDPPQLLLAHFALGTTSFWQGEFISAQAHLEQGVALYDMQDHRSLASLYAVDLGVFCLSYLLWTLGHLGYLEQALQRSQEVLRLAQALAHPHSLAFALTFAGWLHQLRREAQATQERADTAILLSTEQGFPDWVAWAMTQRGWVLAEQGRIKEGITQMQQGLAASRATGAELLRPYFLALLAETWAKDGRAVDGLGAVKEALGGVQQNGVRQYEAELYRLRGELTLQSENQRPESPTREAEVCFLKAIEIARRQQAKSLELRAVMSLSRLWQQQGKKDEAQQQLAEIYNWFTEGFDTKDLQEAKALLEELS